MHSLACAIALGELATACFGNAAVVGRLDRGGDGVDLFLSDVALRWVVCEP